MDSPNKFSENGLGKCWKPFVENGPQTNRGLSEVLRSQEPALELPIPLTTRACDTLPNRLCRLNNSISMFTGLCVTQTGCKYTLEGTHGNFRSPTGSKNSQICEWKITVPYTHRWIKISFTEIDIKGQDEYGSCKSDIVAVSDFGDSYILEQQRQPCSVSRVASLGAAAKTEP